MPFGDGHCVRSSGTTSPATSTTTTTTTPIVHVDDEIRKGGTGRSSSSSGSSNYANINTTTTTRKRKRDEWIMTYNRGLGLLTCGRAQESMEWVWETFQPLLSLLSLEPESTSSSKTSSSSYSGETTKLSQELLGIACRMAFLLLEGVLTLSVAGPMGIPQFLKGALALDRSPTQVFIVSVQRTLRLLAPGRSGKIGRGQNSQRPQGIEASHGNLSAQIETKRWYYYYYYFEY
jgi:hypothetical protein